MKDNGHPVKLSELPSSDESEDEEFCDSIDPEHLSAFQSGLIDTHKLNGTSESHNSSTSTSSPDHIPTSSLTESDMSDLDNEGPTTAERHTSTPFEKKPLHVTFDVEENSKTTKTKHKKSNGKRRVDEPLLVSTTSTGLETKAKHKNLNGRRFHEPHIPPTTSTGLGTSNHLDGGILKVKQAGSGYGGGDISKGLKQPPTNGGFSRTRGGGIGSSGRIMIGLFHSIYDINHRL